MSLKFEAIPGNGPSSFLKEHRKALERTHRHCLPLTHRWLDTARRLVLYEVYIGGSMGRTSTRSFVLFYAGALIKFSIEYETIVFPGPYKPEVNAIDLPERLDSRREEVEDLVIESVQAFFSQENFAFTWMGTALEDPIAEISLSKLRWTLVPEKYSKNYFKAKFNQKLKSARSALSKKIFWIKQTLLSPLSFLIILSLALYVAKHWAEYETVAIVIAVLACGILIDKIRGFYHKHSLSYWLIGRSKYKNALLGSLEPLAIAFADPVFFPDLKIQIHCLNPDTPEYRITFNHTSGYRLSRISIASETLVDLLAPGFRELNESEKQALTQGSKISDLIPEIKTRALLYFDKTAVRCRGIKGFSPNKNEVLVRFQVRTDKPDAFRHVVSVEIV